MRKTALWVSALGLAAAAAAMLSRPARPPAGDGPVIHCAEPEFLFGTRSNLSTVEHVFVLKNAGNRDLVLGNIRSDCGCTVERLGASRLAPDEATTLAVSFNLRGREGPQRIRLYVESDDPARPMLTLALAGEARPDLRVVPARLPLGHIPPGSPVERELAVEWNHEGEFSIRSATCADPSVRVLAQVLEPGRRYRVVLRVVLPEYGQTLNAPLVLRTSSPLAPEIEIPLTASTEPVSCSPAEIVLRPEPGAVAVRHVHLLQGSAGAFSIREIRVPDERIRAAIFPSGARGFRIRLDEIPMDPSLDGRELVIETDLEVLPEIRIPFVFR